VGTLFARIAPTSRSVVEAEAGLGLFGVGSGSSATLIRTAGDHGWLAFEGRHIRVDSAYGGGLRGSGQDAANITIRPFSSLRFSARIDETSSPIGSLVFNPLYLASAQRSVLTSDFGFDLAGLLAGGLRNYSEAFSGIPTTDPTLTEADERSAWGRLSARLGRLSLSVTEEQGTSGDKLTGVTHPFNTTSAQLGIRLPGNMSYAFFAEHNTGQRRFVQTHQDYITLGASAQVQLGPLSLSVAGMGNPLSRFKTALDSGLIAPGISAWNDGTAIWALSNGRSLSFRLHSTRVGTARAMTTTTRIAYNIPLNLPIGKSRTRGRVVGRVYDAETGAGISNAFVKVGDHSALTDEDGRVSFGGMAPNRYPVFVDLGSRQSGGVGFEQGALEVAARAGETSEIGVRVTHLGHLRGKLQLYEAVAGAPLLAGDSVRLRKSHGLAGVVVTVMNGAEERRVLSDSSGWFEVSDARPGMWRIVIPSSQLPALHFIEGDSVRVVDLQAGATQTIEVNVMPRQRKILPLDVLPNQSPKSIPLPLPPAITPRGSDPAIPKTTGPSAAPLGGSRTTKMRIEDAPSDVKAAADSIGAHATDAPHAAAHTRARAAKSTLHSRVLHTTASAGSTRTMERPKTTSGQVSLSDALRQLDLRLDTTTVRRGVSISATTYGPAFMTGSNH
jgi:hypothetical protein